MTAFTVTVRDHTMTEVAPLGGYVSLDLDLRHMGAGGDTGVSEVKVDTSHPSLAAVLASGAGIVVRRTGAGETVASGDVVDVEIDESPAGLVSIMFEADDQILVDELAYPDPTGDVSASATSTFTAALDRRPAAGDGPAETAILELIAANIGPAAGVTRRRYPWLSIPATQSRGETSRWAARMDTLADICRTIAVPSGLAWRLLQTTSGTVEVQIREPAADPASAVRLSAEAGTVTSLVYRSTARSLDEAIIGGAGETASREFTRRTSASYVTGRRRRVTFLDERWGENLTDLRQPADEALTVAAAVAGMTVALVERPATPRFGVDWHLGDMVTAASYRSGTVTDSVQSVRIVHEPGADPVVSPSIGVPGDTGSVSQVATIRRLIDSMLRS